LTEPASNDAAQFIARWRGVAVLPGSTELATAQSFVALSCARSSASRRRITQADLRS